jgi:transcriptional regulator with XRE-family HTH domain
MSTKFTEEFFQWADIHGITREDIAQETGNSKQTISKWRSIGIPRGKEFGLRSYMQRQLRRDTEEIRYKIALEPTRLQFNRWNSAALAERKTIEDWAFDGLEDMAAEYYAQAAENPAPFNQKPNGDVGGSG